MKDNFVSTIPIGLIVVAIGGISVIAAFSNPILAFSGYTNRHAVSQLQEYSQNAGLTPVSCMAADSDGDGYVGCSATDKDGQIVALQCAAPSFFNTGCQSQKISVKNRNSL